MLGVIQCPTIEPCHSQAQAASMCTPVDLATATVVLAAAVNLAGPGMPPDPAMLQLNDLPPVAVARSTRASSDGLWRLGNTTAGTSRKLATTGNTTAATATPPPPSPLRTPVFASSFVKVCQGAGGAV